MNQASESEDRTSLPAVDYAGLLASLEAGKADAAKAREASEAEVRAAADLVLAQLPSVLRNLRDAKNVVVYYRTSAPATDVARELNRRMEIDDYTCSGWASGSSDGGCVYVSAASLERVLRRALPLRPAAVAAAAAAPLGVPYRFGPPPLRLRKVCAQWENGHALPDGSIQVETFSHVGASDEVVHAPGWPDALRVSDSDFSKARYRPHGKTWEEVEALAAEAERGWKPALPRLATAMVAASVKRLHLSPEAWSDEDLCAMEPRQVTAALVKEFRYTHGVGLREAKEALEQREGVALLALEYCHRKGTGTEHRAPLWTRWRALRQQAT